MRDVVILGAGMAGMACARRLLQSGLRPLLIAPAHDVANRGETLSPRALPTLEALGWRDLLDDTTALASAGRFSLWGSPALRRDDSGPGGWHIDRAALEARMAGALEGAGLERLCTEARQIAHKPSHVTISRAHGAPLDAAQLIDCSGRAAVTAGLATPLRRIDRLTAVMCSFALADDAEVLAATLVEAVADGWWYMTVQPGRRALLGFFSDSDLLPPRLRDEPAQWARMIAQTTAIAQRLDSLGADPSACGRLSFSAASTAAQTQLVGPRVIRAGDAACAQDPLGSNGLATALWSGLQAADSALARLNGDETVANGYEQRFLEGIEAFLASQRAIYASERRFPGAPFWRRRNPDLPPPG